MTGGTLFIFSGLAPLDNVPLSQIVSIDIVEEKVFFNTVNETGEKVRIEKPKTPYIMNQIEGFNLEVNS